MLNCWWKFINQTTNHHEIQDQGAHETLERSLSLLQICSHVERLTSTDNPLSDYLGGGLKPLFFLPGGSSHAYAVSDGDNRSILDPESTLANKTWQKPVRTIIICCTFMFFSANSEFGSQIWDFS